MAALGPYLRDLRERRGLSLEEMARATRVATRYLEALEADDFRALPAPAFTKGFIRAWCQAVGADPAEALARYQPHAGPEHPRPAAPAVDATAKAHAQARANNRGTILVSFVLLVVLGVALFAVTLVLQSDRDRIDRRANLEPARSGAGAPSASPGEEAGGPESQHAVLAPHQSTAVAGRSVDATEKSGSRPIVPTTTGPAVPAPPTKSSPSTAPPPPTTASSSPGATSAPAPALGAAPPVVLGAVTSPYRLVARVIEPTWIRVRTVEGRFTEETIPAGEVREWVSSAPFVLTVGNAGGVTLELNGRPLPPLGERGAVIPRLVIPPTGQ